MKKETKKVTNVPTKKTTKKKLILAHLIKHKSITSFEAIEKYSATRLSAIIFDLRKAGYGIATKEIAMTDKFGNKGFYAKYLFTSYPKK